MACLRTAEEHGTQPQKGYSSNSAGLKGGIKQEGWASAEKSPKHLIRKLRFKAEPGAGPAVQAREQVLRVVVISPSPCRSRVRLTLLLSFYR